MFSVSWSDWVAVCACDVRQGSVKLLSCVINFLQGQGFSAPLDDGRRCGSGSGLGSKSETPKAAQPRPDPMTRVRGSDQQV